MFDFFFLNRDKHCNTLSANKTIFKNALEVTQQTAMPGKHIEGDLKQKRQC